MPGQDLKEVSLKLVPRADNMPGDIQDAIDEARSRLNGKDVDYEQTVSTKIEIAQCIFGRQGKEDLEVRLLVSSLCIQSAAQAYETINQHHSPPSMHGASLA